MMNELISNKDKYNLINSGYIEHVEGNSLMKIERYDMDFNKKIDLYFVYYIGYYINGKFVNEEDKIKKPLFISRDNNEDERTDVTYRLYGSSYIIYSTKYDLVLERLAKAFEKDKF